YCLLLAVVVSVVVVLSCRYSFYFLAQRKRQSAWSLREIFCFVFVVVVVVFAVSYFFPRSFGFAA
ncbi:MAG: hypothetical protein LBC07_01625, partial [Elusimicrobiota bacterium]|nr:hypothetical protein [Elusimicrobiota bacterium]